jgi:hypothetical protein
VSCNPRNCLALQRTSRAGLLTGSREDIGAVTLTSFRLEISRPSRAFARVEWCACLAEHRTARTCGGGSAHTTTARRSANS